MKKKSMLKKTLSVLLAMCIILAMVPVCASAAKIDDARRWMEEKNGWCLDYDNVYGAQCVDIVMRYCNDLFGWAPSGNAEAYRYNYLPSGWQRFQYSSGMVPQRGDIIVFQPNWGYPIYTGDAGHVGLIWSADANGMYTFEQNTGEGNAYSMTTYMHQLYRTYNGVWGFIRPPFSDNGSVSTVKDNITLDDPWVGFTTDDNAQIGSFIRNGGAVVGATSFGLQVWEKATGTRIVNHTEDISSRVQQMTEIKIWNNLTSELGVTLKPGTQYEFQFSAVKGGKTYYSTKSVFTTTGRQTVTLKFSPGDGTGTALTKEAALGEPFAMPACTFTAPTGKAFSKWWSPAVGSYSAGESMTLDASKYKAGSTIEFTASWEVINPTKLTTSPIVIEELTPTNLVLSCEVEFTNLENRTLDNVYFDFIDHVLYIRQGSGPDADGNVKYTLVETHHVPYTVEELTNGKHKLTVDLDKEGIQLLPNTSYKFEWMFGFTSKTILSRLITLTTPEQDEGPGEYAITGVTAKDGVYDGTAQSGFTGTPAAEGFNGKISVHYAGRDGTAYDSAEAPKNAGKYTVRFTADDGSAYGELALDFSIIKAGISIYADNKDVKTGGVLPRLTYIVTGLAKGDSLSTLPKLAYTTQPVLAFPATYVIRASGAKVPAGGNYEEKITYTDGILNVYAEDEPGGVTEITGLTLDQKEIYLTPGSSAVLKPLAEPADAQADRYIWQSDNARTAKVDANGRVTGVASGRTTVRVTTSDGRLSASCAVVVGPWYQKAVDYVQREGLMNGYGNGSFGPNDRLTRAQLVQILYNKGGRPNVSVTGEFSDVRSTNWYGKAVSWAVGRKIVNGYGNGRFGPNNNISRQDLAVILWRYAGSPASSGSVQSFSDAYKISNYAQEAMRWAVEKHILNGSGGKLDPKGFATRAQVAQMLMNYLSK